MPSSSKKCSITKTERAAKKAARMTKFTTKAAPQKIKSSRLGQTRGHATSRGETFYRKITPLEIAMYGDNGAHAGSAKGRGFSTVE